MSVRRDVLTPLTPREAFPASSRRWWILVATCFGLFMILLDITIVNVALPTIQRDLHAPFAAIQWVINAYTLALAVLLVTAGRLGDLFGRKRLFLIGLLLFALSSLLCGLAGRFSPGVLSPIELLLAARACQGIGGAIILPLSLALITATFSGRERGIAISIWGGISGFGLALGPVVGGLLIQYLGWPSIFFLNVPISVIGMILTGWATVESRDTSAAKTVDVFGMLTLMVGLFCLMFALISGNDNKWGSPFILILFGVAAGMLLLFLTWEARQASPMMDPRLFRNASFTGAAITAFALNAGLYALFLFLTLYLQDFLGFSAFDAGIRFMILSVAMLLGSLLAGRLMHRLGERLMMAGGMAGTAAGVLLLTLISAQNRQTDWIILLPGFVLGGIASGLANPTISQVAVGTVERVRVGMASGVSTACRQVGIAFGTAFLGALLTSTYHGSLQTRILVGTMRSTFIDGTIMVFRAAAVILAAGAIVAWLLVKPSGRVYERESEDQEKSKIDTP